MSDATTPSTRQPFHTIVTGGGFHAGYETRQAAESGAKRANDAAAEMGIAARYEAVDGPREVSA